jgi:VWFA-related protein
MTSTLLSLPSLFLALLLLQSPHAHTQLRTIIDSTDTERFPEIVLYVRVMQGDNSVKDMRIQDFTLLENGIPLPIVAGYCQDTIARAPVSVLLVIDISRSMGPWPFGSNALVDAQRAAKSFIDRLSDDDEAALISFSADVYYNQSWTNDWALMKSRIDQLRVIGATSLWDAVFSGTNVIQNRTKKKVMIVLTDGEDTGSSTPFQTALNAAIDADVVTYTIGLGREIEEDRLRLLASSTGGRFFAAPEAADLDQIYAEINLSLVTTGVCELHYVSPIDCWNGDDVTVEVHARTTQGIASGSTTYTLPYDTTTFSYVTLAMERDYVVAEGDRITVPVELVRVSDNRAPSVFDFSVNYDNDILTLVEARPADLSTGYLVTMTPTDRGATLRLTGSDALTSTGTLLELLFEAQSTFVSRKSEITISPPDVQQFCTVAASFNGLITVSGSCERALGAPLPGSIRATILAVSPNPFNPSTTVRYHVSERTHVTLLLTDMLGRRVRTLLSGEVPAGAHDVVLDAENLPGGAYVVSVYAGMSSDMHRIMLLK